MHEMGWICTLKRPIELLTPNLLSNRGFHYKVQGARVGYIAALFGGSGKMSVRKCEIQIKIHVIKSTANKNLNQKLRVLKYKLFKNFYNTKK